MDTDKQNEEIAKICGWHAAYSPASQRVRWYEPDGFKWDRPPNYTDDHENMAKAVERIPANLTQTYIDHLKIIIGKANIHDIREATTEHCAEALLRAYKRWETLNPEQQNEAIALVLGWKKKPTTGLMTGDNRVWICPDYSRWHEFTMTREIPNFVNDLNAMYIAEAWLSDEGSRKFFDELNWVVARSDKQDCKRGPLWCMFHASAAERAEAFLKTLDLWE